MDNFSLFVNRAVASFGYTGMFEHADGKVVDWHDFKSPPTDEELQAKIDELVLEHEANQYQRDRVGSGGTGLNNVEYPSIGDQLDMIYKDMKNNTTTHADAIEIVKAKYPKPK